MKRREQTCKSTLSVNKAIMLVIVALLSLASSKAYSVNPLDRSLPALVLENDTLEKPERMPEFPGGKEELIKRLSIYYKYEGEPYTGMDRLARCIVQFIIDTEGNVIKPRIIKSVDPFFDKEALRITSELPRWKPGMHGGKPVITRYTVPVTFKLYQ